MMHTRLAVRRGLGRGGLAAALAAAAMSAAAAPPLPAYGALRGGTTVSRLSAGGFMAVQLQVAYSASIQGAGVVAGGAYHCAEGNPLFTGLCMGRVPFFVPGASTAMGFARAFAASGTIDPLDHLRHRRVYLFSGTADRVVQQPAVDAAAAFFRGLGVDGARLLYVNDVPAGHAMVTPGAANDCAANADPYLNHCTVGGSPYDQAGALLAHLYPGLKTPRAPIEAGAMTPFDQRPFAPTSTTGMADTAYLYVPADCRAVGAHCRVHVALHGCEQAEDRPSSGTPRARFVADAGYARWADANALLVLYPQVGSAARPDNPHGCWDWWGYTGADYDRRTGPQMKAIMAMVGRLTQRR